MLWENNNLGLHLNYSKEGLNYEDAGSLSKRVVYLLLVRFLS